LEFTLASAVLQLYKTPWLSTAWTSNDILMLRAATGDALLSDFSISRTFGPTTTSIAIEKRRCCVKNELVFSLGVALLELSYRQPLLSLKTSDDLNEQGMEDSMTELSIATRLAYRIHGREMEN